MELIQWGSFLEVKFLVKSSITYNATSFDCSIHFICLLQSLNCWDCGNWVSLEVTGNPHALRASFIHYRRVGNLSKRFPASDFPECCAAHGESEEYAQLVHYRRDIIKSAIFPSATFLRVYLGIIFLAGFPRYFRLVIPAGCSFEIRYCTLVYIFLVDSGRRTETCLLPFCSYGWNL